MLSSILLRVSSQKFSLTIFCCPGDCIEFVVAEHRPCGVGLAHTSCDPQDFPLVGATINKVAHKYSLPGFVSERAPQFLISKFDQQSSKRVGVSVNVTDYVVALLRHYL